MPTGGGKGNGWIRGMAVGREIEGQATPAAEFDASHIEKFLDQHPDSMMGGWHDSGSGEIFLDPVDVLDNQSEAEALGVQRNQIAIGDLAKYAKGEDGEIKVGGTGGLK